MSGVRHERPQRIALAEAAEFLELSQEAVLGLAAAGFLASDAGVDGPEFALLDLRAFQARNAENGSGNLVFDEVGSADPQDLLDALDGKSDEMARRAFTIFASVFPEATSWTPKEQTRFISQARARFEAILAVTGQGIEVDEALVGDLEEVGAAAAWAGSPLPHLLAILRISRDLVVQTAVEIAEQRGRHWGLALSLVLTRVLPALDRLTDALAQGYWAALMGREAEVRARYENVIEHAANGVYEVDLDGVVQYANPAMAVLTGLALGELERSHLTDVLVPFDTGASLDPLLSDPPGGAARVELTVRRADGVRRVLEIRTVPRYQGERLVGFQGVVRDMTAALDLEADKNDFLALVTRDLRAPLKVILGQGANLEAHAEEMSAEQVARTGSSVRRHAERISRLADDLHDISRLGSSEVSVNLRSCDVAAVVGAALHSVDDPVGVEVRVTSGTEVLADPPRLEQVVANLVENALFHGVPPVVVDIDRERSGDHTVDILVTDAGPGVPEGLVPSLFSGLRSYFREPPAGAGTSRTRGYGLSLVKGLVEAMGGRVTYEAPVDGGARFRVSLPVPRRR